MNRVANREPKRDGRLKPPRNHNGGRPVTPDSLARAPLLASGACRLHRFRSRRHRAGVPDLVPAGRLPGGPRKCYLPRQAARCSIRFAEKVAEASPRFRGERARHQTKEIRPRVRNHDSGAARSPRWKGITRGRVARRWAERSAPEFSFEVRGQGSIERTFPRNPRIAAQRLRTPARLKAK